MSRRSKLNPNSPPKGRDGDEDASARRYRGFRSWLRMHGLQPRLRSGPDRDEAIRLIRYAVELGCTHFDTAEGYGAGHNEFLVGEALKPVRDQVAIATKLRVNERTSEKPAEQQIREHLEASLKRLGRPCQDNRMAREGGESRLTG